MFCAHSTLTIYRSAAIARFTKAPKWKWKWKWNDGSSLLTTTTQGPDPIAKGVSAAIKDAFPVIKEVQFT
jgi:hypothetical protein